MWTVCTTICTASLFLYSHNIHTDRSTTHHKHTQNIQTVFRKDINRCSMPQTWNWCSFTIQTMTNPMILMLKISYRNKVWNKLGSLEIIRARKKNCQYGAQSWKHNSLCLHQIYYRYSWLGELAHNSLRFLIYLQFGKCAQFTSCSICSAASFSPCFECAQNYQEACVYYICVLPLSS